MSEKNPIRTAVASGQPIFLHGLASLIMSTQNVRLVGEARNGAEALQLAEMTSPDLIVLDADHLQQTQELVVRLHQGWPPLKIILLCDLGAEDPHWREEPLLYPLSCHVTEQEFQTAIQEIARDAYAGDSTARMPGTAEEAVEVHVLPQPPRQSNEETMTRELSMAGKIQTDILPEVEPDITGWDIAARLEPARETSGDFYDFIPLAGHKWGIAVADVSDKGMGAALFMALSSSLLRTYAGRFPTLPAVILSAVSERILSDTRSGMFVTAFFGILETHTGRMVFANAGHPPGFLITTQRGKISVDHLRPTGMALGVSGDARWRQKLARLGTGDFLVLYTDGITEAQDPHGQFFGEERLLDTVLAKCGRPAKEIAAALIDEVHRFTGNVPKQDDIALLVIRRIE